MLHFIGKRMSLSLIHTQTWVTVLLLPFRVTTMARPLCPTAVARSSVVSRHTFLLSQHKLRHCRNSSNHELIPVLSFIFICLQYVVFVLIKFAAQIDHAFERWRQISFRKSQLCSSVNKCTCFWGEWVFIQSEANKSNECVSRLHGSVVEYCLHFSISHPSSKFALQRTCTVKSCIKAAAYMHFSTSWCVLYSSAAFIWGQLTSTCKILSAKPVKVVWHK